MDMEKQSFSNLIGRLEKTEVLNLHRRKTQFIFLEKKKKSSIKLERKELFFLYRSTRILLRTYHLNQNKSSSNLKTLKTFDDEQIYLMPLNFQQRGHSKVNS